MKAGRKPEYPEKTPDDELQKMPHTKARKFKPQPRRESTPDHWRQAWKADVLVTAPRVALMCKPMCKAIVCFVCWLLNVPATG